MEPQCARSQSNVTIRISTKARQPQILTENIAAPIQLCKQQKVQSHILATHCAIMYLLHFSAYQNQQRIATLEVRQAYTSSCENLSNSRIVPGFGGLCFKIAKCNRCNDGNCAPRPSKEQQLAITSVAQKRPSLTHRVVFQLKQALESERILTLWGADSRHSVPSPHKELRLRCAFTAHRITRSCQTHARAKQRMG